MIRTVAGLLDSLKQREMELIAQSGIRHAPTIGAQYEGLTTDLLRRMIPEDLGLRVVSGFVEGHDGTLSGQIDCMLVCGTGTPVYQTPLFKWPIRQVIALFEVKKTLFSTQLEEAHHHLNSVLDMYIAFTRSLGPEVRLNLEPALHAFGQIVGHRAPERSRFSELPYTQQMIYQTLVTEQFAPLRIVFGYQGYASEHSLRNGFLDFLERNPCTAGFGTTSLPSLIVCGGHSLVKLNGHPYGLGMRGDAWMIYASSENPMILLLNLIWTKLSYGFELPAWFDHDLGMERFSPLLSGIAVQRENLSGWEYSSHEYTRRELESREAVPEQEWRPVTVTPFQEALLFALGADDGISPEELIELRASVPSEDPDGELQVLLDRRLVGRSGDRLVFLTRECATVVTPWGETLAGDNADGRLFAWVRQEEARRNSRTS
jgi:hypothetical protein